MKDISDYVRKARSGHHSIALEMPPWPETVARDDPRLLDRSWPENTYGPGNLTKWTPEERWALEMRAYLMTRKGRYWRGLDCDKTVGPPLAPGVKWYCQRAGDRTLTRNLWRGRCFTVAPVAWAIGVHRMKLNRLIMADPFAVQAYIRIVAPAMSREVRYALVNGRKMLEIIEAFAVHGVRCKPKSLDIEELCAITSSASVKRLAQSDAMRASRSGRTKPL